MNLHTILLEGGSPNSKMLGNTGLGYYRFLEPRISTMAQSVHIFFTLDN